MKGVVTLLVLLMVAVAPAAHLRQPDKVPPSEKSLQEYVKYQLDLFNCQGLEPVPDTKLWSACNNSKPAIKDPDSDEDIRALLCLAYLDMATRWCYRNDLNNTAQDLNQTLQALKDVPKDFCPLPPEALPFNASQPDTYVTILSRILSNATLCARECQDLKGAPSEPCLTIARGNIFLSTLPPAPKKKTVQERRKIANDAKKLAKSQSKQNQSTEAPVSTPTKENSTQIQKEVVLPKVADQIKVAPLEDKLKVQDENQVQPNLPQALPKKEEPPKQIEPPTPEKEFQLQEHDIPTKVIEKVEVSGEEYADPEEQGEKDEVSQDLVNSAITKKPYISDEELVADKEKNKKLPTKEQGYQIGNFDQDQPQESNFFIYFIFAFVALILGYVIFHNKNKFLGLLVEGRKGSSTTRRRGGGAAYRKLDCTLEEAVSSTPPSHGPHIVY